MLPRLARSALTAGFLLTAGAALAQPPTSTPTTTQPQARQPTSSPPYTAHPTPPADPDAPLPGDEALAHNPVPPGM